MAGKQVEGHFGFLEEKVVERRKDAILARKKKILQPMVNIGVHDGVDKDEANRRKSC